MPQCTHHDLQHLFNQEGQPGLFGKVATQHVKLYRLAKTMTAPTILEFGVAQGMSTCLLAAACEETGGHLYSVDIVDCSAAVRSPAWTFIQQNDLNVEAILAAAPMLQNGIDLLHIDSAHSEAHVREQLMRWYPYVNANGYITFHDVDPTPYRSGQRKDNPRHELEAIKVSEVIRAFFYANEDDLFLEFHFGSTGMGIMRKLCPRGTRPNPPLPLRSRLLNVSPSALFWSARRWLAQRVKRSS